MIEAQFDTKGLEEVFKELRKTAELRLVAAGAYAGLDLSSDLSRKQSTFKPLSLKYARRKAREGFQPEAWTRTGATAAALSAFSQITGSRSTERVGGLVFNFRFKSSYIETDTMAKNKRKAKDAFYATNARRRLFVWDQQKIQAAINNLIESFERQLGKVIDRKMRNG